ncbi:MAG: alpha/beta hydrolase [Rhodocyclales bacterium]|nr:alpha/beta hydrolase [Rhodocyclales bacterium]
MKLNYEVVGEGEPIICIHGVLGSHKQWKYLMATLAGSGGYQVYAFDLRGYGNSDKPSDGYTLPVFVEDLRTAMDALGISRATLVGFSLGLIVVTSFAVRYPERTKRLVLVGNAAHVPRTPRISIGAFFSPLLFALKRFTGRWIVKNFFTNINEKTEADFEAVVEDVMRTPLWPQVRSLKAGMVVDLREEVKRMAVPVLGIFATGDRLVYLDQAEAMRGCIKTGRVEIIENSGHMPMLEQPEKFNKIVLDFLRESD